VSGQVYYDTNLKWAVGSWQCLNRDIYHGEHWVTRRKNTEFGTVQLRANLWLMVFQSSVDPLSENLFTLQIRDYYIILIIIGAIIGYGNNRDACYTADFTCHSFCD
jgi:hypothetical protein